MSVRAPELQGGAWVSGGPLSIDSLKGTAVLLDFFTFGCINCMNNLFMLKLLQERYGKALQVIGVHSGKFAYEKGDDAVRTAVERLQINHPVLNDPQGRLVDQYTIKAWPTMVLIDAKGYIAAQFRGEGQGVAIDLALKKLGIVPKREHLRQSVPATRLSFPEAVACAGEHLYVANSGGGDVREYTSQGVLLRCFGAFDRPAALALHENMLYIADRNAGSVCSIDLKSEERTVLFEGLRSPSAVLAEARRLTVAEAGAHVITVYDAQTLDPRQRFGNRYEALRDGEGDSAQLAQPMGLARCDDDTLWFVDAESSSLRMIEGNSVRTAIGEGLFTFGDSDTDPILLQHPQGIACGRIGDGCGAGRLFVADTYNGKIKAYDPLSGRMMTLAEGLCEPTGIVKCGCFLYITETGRHRILRFDLSAMRMDAVIG